MSTLLLVRHGQASWNAADYDVLSALGHEQGATLGRAWTERGVRPDVLVHGGLRRQQDTATALRDGLGYDVPVVIDRDWAEFDHVAILAAHGAPASELEQPGGLEAVLDAALSRWRDGSYDTSVESWGSFTKRVLAAAERAQERPGLTAVVSSAGPIGVVAGALLGGGTLDSRLWRRVNGVVVNSSVTTVVRGRSGRRLVTFNEHVHLAVGQVSYR